MFLKRLKLANKYFGILSIAGSKIGLPNSRVEIINRRLYSELPQINTDYFDTYRYRILNYFRTNYKFNKNCVNLSVIANKKPCNSLIEHVKEEKFRISCFDLTQDCLESNIYKLSSENQGVLDHKILRNTLDAVCCTRIDGMTNQEILRLLDAWMHAFPNEITKMKFYKVLLQKIKSCATKILSVEDAIQYLFYISLQKRGVSDIVQHMLNIIEQNNNLCSLTLEELCIIATSAFQSSTKILSANLLLHLESALEAHMKMLMDDSQLLVAIIKALRHARHYNYKLLDALAEDMLQYKKLPQYSFTVRTHIMIMFADALYGREDISKEITALNVEDMLAKNKTIRAKDISSFLWAAGYLGVTIEMHILENVFTTEIMHCIRRNEYRKNPSDIVDSALSLWMLGYKADRLVDEAIAPSIVSSLEGKMRFMSRLQLLMTCVSIEAPNLLQEKHKALMKKSAKLPGLNVREELRKRPSLQKVYSATKFLTANLDLKNVTVKGSIPHLNIGGVVVQLPTGKVNIEVLDDKVCLYKSRQPHGVMKLKLRLLRTIGNELIIVNDEDDYMDHIETIMIFLEDAMKKATILR